MRVLVVTIAHRGDDARIVHREARAMLEAGHAVTLVAPEPDDRRADPLGLVRVPVRRAVGRRRVGAWREVRRVVRERLADHDLVLLHDPELVLVAARRWFARPVVWDVHEDYVASVADRTWIPAPVRAPVAAVVRRLQTRAVRRLHVVIAEHSYAATFADAPVVPNSSWVPSPRTEVREPPEVVYVGRLSFARGVEQMIALGEALAGEVRVVLVGPADIEVAARLHEAADVVDWRGPLPNPQALELARGAVLGLSLLHDIPNYHHSMPTKVIEYMAHGIPVVTTPLPLARDLVTESGGGVVVPFDDLPALVETVRSIVADPSARDSYGSAGHAYVSIHHNWAVDAERFVGVLEEWAAQR